MPQFSKKTLLTVTDLLDHRSHSEITRFLMENDLEDAAPESLGKRSRINSLVQYLLEEPDRVDDLNRNHFDSVVEQLVEGMGESLRRGNLPEAYVSVAEKVIRSLERDGFSFDEDWQMRRALPSEAVDLPEADDEVHTLLDAYGFETSKGHLDQAIAAHTRGDWAAANSQLRAFVESLLDEIAAGLASPSDSLPQPGHQRRQWLANLSPPFYGSGLNEWTNDGKGFLEGFFKRLHPQGSHPGLSDEDDSTFRLHLVLIVARLLLRRFDQRAGT